MKIIKIRKRLILLNAVRCIERYKSDISVTFGNGYFLEVECRSVPIAEKVMEDIEIELLDDKVKIIDINSLVATREIVV